MTIPEMLVILAVPVALFAACVAFARWLLRINDALTELCAIDMRLASIDHSLKQLPAVRNAALRDNADMKTSPPDWPED
jgi:hypothetical protein